MTTTTQPKPFKRRGRAPLADLLPAANNPRVIDPPNLNGLAATLDAFGQVQDVVVNQRTGRIVGGHQRVKALAALGETHADVTWVDLDDAQENALRVALNNPHTQGRWTDDLDKILGPLEHALPEGLFQDLHLDALLGPVDPPPAVAPPRQHTVAKREVDAPPGDWAVVVGDNRSALRGMADNSVDAVVTDPPYELAFMGRAWDRTGIAYDVTLWREVLRVLKPGGFLVAFGGTRTFHRMACAVEDAGFEVRDQLAWMFGTGFPKSLNVAKAVEAQELTGGSSPQHLADAVDQTGQGVPASPHHKGMKWNPDDGTQQGVPRHAPGNWAPTTAAAVQWDGYGTALKPAHEPILLARKPLVGTVAENVQAHGAGALNIAAGRLEGPTARFPSNVILDRAAAGELPENARRFFYCPKAARGEREVGLDALPRVTGAAAVQRKEGSAGTRNPRAGAGRTASSVKNTHPTVKPVDLMRYLVALVCPIGGTVLDPFAGSGSTGIGALLAGASFLGLELETPHACIAWHRLTWWAQHAADWAEVLGEEEPEPEEG